MSDGSTRTLTVLFQTPKGDDSPCHERVFENIPNSVAEDMAEDFAAARDPGSEASPYQLYRYEEEGTEHLIALDYTEVLGVFV